MGLTASPWDDRYFASKGGIACGTIAFANLPPSSLHQIGATFHIPTDMTIDAVLAADPDTNLIGDFSSTGANVEPLCVRKTFYLPAPFAGIFLERDLTPVVSWTSLHGAISNRGLEVNFRPIIDWILVSLTLKNGDYKSPLAMLRSAAPLADGDLLQHRHNILTCHLPRMYPSLQRVQGSLIVTHIGDVVVEMSRDIWEEALACQADKEKGIPDLLGSNIICLLRLGRLVAHKYLPPVWNELVKEPKSQHLTTLQRALDNTARRLSARVPIVVTPGLLNLTLSLGFRLYHHSDLGTGLHQFGVGQHTSATWKVLKAHSDQHQVFAGGVAAPSLDDVVTLTAPDGVSLSATLSMARGSHARLRVVLVTLFSQYRPTALAMNDVN